jgi:hypothetical protein
LQLPTLNTNNHGIFSLGNETKHKGITKGNGGLAINSCYGIEELKEWKIYHMRSHMLRWDSNMLARVSCHWLHVEKDDN